MNGKTDDEILAERANAIQAVWDSAGEEIEVINSFFQDAPSEARPLWYLGKSLELLSEADIAYFAPGWEKCAAVALKTSAPRNTELSELSRHSQV